MKHLITLLLSFIVLQSWGQKLVPIDPIHNVTTKLDSLFKHVGEDQKFQGRIYEVNFLGDTAAVLTCGEYKKTKQSLFVLIRDKRILSDPGLMNVLGSSILTKGVLTDYDGHPTFIVDERHPQNIITIVDNPAPRGR